MITPARHMLVCGESFCIRIPCNDAADRSDARTLAHKRLPCTVKLMEGGTPIYTLYHRIPRSERG